MTNNAYLSSEEAASLLGCTPRYIQIQIKKGKLSAKKDEAGHYQIDKAEFYRVYPDAFQSEKTEKSDELETNKVAILEMKISHLEEMLESKKREHQFALEQLASHMREKNIILDSFVSAQKLLEHTSSKKDIVEKKKKRFGIF